jgi:Ser/Thr protein kinase RdoA (MazF antagonist)
MMTLAHMWSVLRTLDKGRGPLLDQLAAFWGAAPHSTRLLRASANFVSSFEHKGKTFILRFNYADERRLDHLQAEIDYLLHLAAQGIPIAKPIASQKGHFIESLSTSEGEFHAVVFEALPGEHPEFDDLTPDQFRQWGQALARLHKAAESYTLSGRTTWQDHIAAIEARLPDHESDAHALLSEVKEQLSALSTTPQNFGLIHFDFELDNLLWHNGQINIIDFDDSAFYWFAADIAFALRDLFNDDAGRVNVSDPTLLTFLAGYRSVKAMPDEEIAHLPLFLRLHNLLLFTRIIRSLGPDAPPDDPDWMKALRTRFHAKLYTYRANFEEQARD